MLASLVLVTLAFGREEGTVAGVRSGAASATQPLQLAANRVAEPFRDAWGWVSSLVTAHGDARRLAQENEELRQRLVRGDLALRENDRLRALLDFEAAPDFPGGFDGLAAAVIARPAGAYAQAIVIAAGRKDGVAVDDPVVTEDGLVGRVSQVVDGSARVVLLTDERSAVSAVVVRTDAAGIVRRGQGPRSALRLDRVPKEQQVRRGDTIVTAGWKAAGLQSLYPRGIPIGRVASVGQSDTFPYKQVQVEPFADFAALDAVLVLIPEERVGETP